MVQKSAGSNPQDQPPLTSMKLHETRGKSYGCFQKIWGTPKRMVFFMENPMKMDDLGVPLLLETPISSWFSRRISWSINRWNNSQFWPTSLRRLDYANVSANVSDVSVRRKLFFWGREIWKAGKGSEKRRVLVEGGKWKERFVVQIYFFQTEGIIVKELYFFWGIKQCKSMIIYECLEGFALNSALFALVT